MKPHTRRMLNRVAGLLEGYAEALRVKAERRQSIHSIRFPPYREIMMEQRRVCMERYYHALELSRQPEDQPYSGTR